MPNNNEYITRIVSSNTYCSGTDRYCDVEVQVSYDSGETWTTSSTTPTFISHNASECIKMAVLNDRGHVIGTIPCNGSSSLTSGETYAAFDKYHCSIRGVVVSGCTTRIEYNAFYRYRNLISAALSSGITYIDYHAFSTYTTINELVLEATTPPAFSGFADHAPEEIKVHCSALYDYLTDSNWMKYYGIFKPIETSCVPTIPSDLKVYCIYLYGANLSSGSVQCDGATELSKYDIREAMGGNRPPLVVFIGDCINSISATTFSGNTSLANVYLPNTVTSIGEGAFAECRVLRGINIPSGLTSIGDMTFFNCTNLTSVTIPERVATIGSIAFYGCNSLTSITIPSSVTSIGERAFMYCASMTAATIGSRITNIGDNAFRDCSGLTSITIDAVTPPTLGTDALYTSNNCPIFVPSESVSAYQSAWSSYTSRIQAKP